jgi:hypothetical protein
MLRFTPAYFLTVNKASETFITDGGAKRRELLTRALGNQFHAAIGQVADEAGDFITGGDSLHGVTKPDALHAAGIKNIQAALLRGRRAGWRFNRHGRMKPNPAAMRNVFCLGGRSAILFFLLNLFDRLKILT